MCLLGLALRQYRDFPVLVLANREEFFARPSGDPRLVPRAPERFAWFGGIDLVAGGTWLGVNELGLVVAVTNRPKSRVPADPPSRGLLARRLLELGESVPRVDLAMRELATNRYAGCNLLIADHQSAVAIEAGDELKLTTLGPGLHLIANGPLENPRDGRIERVRRELRRTNPPGVGHWFEQARQLCGLHQSGSEPAICLMGHDRGTVSSTVLGIGSELADSRFWHSPGPPDRTAYQDLSPAFRELFAARIGEPPSGSASADVTAQAVALPDIEPPEDSPARRAVREKLDCADLRTVDPPAGAPYRIHLRGPWQCQPLARADRRGDDSINWTMASLPTPGTVRLPATWQELFGPFRGRVRFTRTFHPPSNIDQGTRLFVVLDRYRGTGMVSLNGRVLGTINGSHDSARFEITGLLTVNNTLQIELEFTDANESNPGGLHGPIAIEIVESD